MGVRHLMIALAFSCYALGYVSRVDLSSSIEQITDIANNDTGLKYDWDESIKSKLLSSMFLGYLWLQLPAGIVADLYGSRIIVGVSVLIIALTKLLTPLSIFIYDWYGLAVCRIVEGLAQGCLLPAVTPFITKWLTTNERTYFSQLVFGGVPFGVTFGLITSGTLLGTQFDWPFMYYFWGIICMVWCIIWMIFSSNTPETHWFITEKEKKYIVTSISRTTELDKSQFKVPWCSILTSAPVYVLILTHTVRNWGYWMVFTQTPRYIDGVAKNDIRGTGFFGSFPNIFSCVMVLVYTSVNYYFQKYNVFSLTFRRKIWITIALLGQGVSYLLLVYISSTDIFLIVVILCLGGSTTVAMYSGTLANQTDLSPNFCGTLTAFTTIFGTLAGIFAPHTVNYIVTDKNSISQWNVVFITCAGLCLVGNIFYLCFGSAEVQPWNNPSNVAKDSKAGKKKTSLSNGRKVLAC